MVAIDAELEHAIEMISKYCTCKIIKGKVLQGMISYISERSLFVELTDSGCEELRFIKKVCQSEMRILSYDNKTFSAIGRRTKRKYKIGDNITVMQIKDLRFR